jgi:hypothetical protein
MKKIGLLFGQENGFPQALIERVNEKQIDDITAEAVSIDKVIQGIPSGYTVLLDRISQDVPFYRTWLKQAALDGTAVINNPFWWSADDKFVNNALAERSGIKVPKTALIPSRDLPLNTNDQSFRNLVYPFDWDTIFNTIGFPAYMKPYNGGGWKHVYKIHDREEFFAQHARTGQLVMMLQEEIKFQSYYRCYCIGGKYVRVIPYDPYQPENQRYLAEDTGDSTLVNTIADQVAQLNQYLGYDFNSVEIAVRDGVPYLIDFWNPAPETNAKVIGAENFEWVVETAATYAIQRAQQHTPGIDNLTWGNYLKQANQAQTAPGEPEPKQPSVKKASVSPAKTPKDDLKEPVAQQEAVAKKTPAKKTKKKE